MSKNIEGVLRVDSPSGDWLPIVLDSPHSGTVFPASFKAYAPLEMLRVGEDCFCDELFPGTTHGAVMIAALFPRTFIDPNRALADLDTGAIDGDWPHPVSPSNKSEIGTGLIWTKCIDGSPIYDWALSIADVCDRIDNYWRPYRSELSRTLDAVAARAGAVWHINCHSMPSTWPPGVDGAGEPVEADFLLGNRDGETCSQAMLDLVHDTLTAQGFRVAVNDRFKGVDIVQSSGDPANDRHSLQIEVVRDRYIDEDTFERNKNFPVIQSALGETLKALGEHARANATW